MSEQVTITSVTANTPVDISYSYANSGSSVYVATVSTFPFTFDVPDPYDLADFLVIIEDTQGCLYSQEVYITPTPTPSITPSQTVTPTVTTTPSNTPSYTPTTTPTITVTSTVSPTVTPSPTTTPVLSYHNKGQNTYSASGTCCGDILTSTYYYTYINQADLIPVVGVTVYTTQVSGTLYNPFNGGNNWILLQFGGNLYAVQINTVGQIVDYVFCSSNTTPTPTNTQTPTQTPTNTTTQTPTPSVTAGLTPTATETQTATPTQTPTNTITQTSTNTPTNTATQTKTPTNTPTNTKTQTQTPTNTPTNTITQTPTNTLTQTPTSTVGTVDIGIISYIFSGSVGIGYKVVSEQMCNTDVTVSFINILGTTTGASITNYSEVTIPSGGYTGFTQSFINGNYSELNGSSSYSSVTVTYSGGTQYFYYNGENINVFGATPTPTNTPTNTQTVTSTQTTTPSTTATAGLTPTATETQTPTPSVTPIPCECWSVRNEDTQIINFTYTPCSGIVSTLNIPINGQLILCSQSGTPIIINSPIGGILGQYNCGIDCTGNPGFCSGKACFPTPTPTRTPTNTPSMTTSMTPTNTPSMSPTKTTTPTITPTCFPGTYATQSTEMINGWNLIYGSSGYTVDPQGFLYQIMSSGTTHPTTADTISVTYTGKTMNNVTFDSSVSPISFLLSGLILGWQYALPLVGVGGQIRFIVPASLAYGCDAIGSIPANSPLDFTVNLISIVPPPSSTPTPTITRTPTTPTPTPTITRTPTNTPTTTCFPGTYATQSTEMINGWNLIYGSSGYTVDPQGFLYQIMSSGTTHPTTANTVSVTYTGKTMNGTTFDSTVSPISFPLSGTILGWQYALPLIGVGGQIRFIVPASLGYGCSAAGSIPANSPTDYTVNLISVT
jgi:hypothetical protein